ncbi:NHS-like protein 2 isoform X3 [Hippoglossus hippoglossus]|uniref:NHS-like protein 2 isoform X3 n=1 Tax=Hippoglossus hippoglossus TaxID=8267 RepID=UPI00148B3F3E|nr:NHS-like protein 2 isoform X3 [Hippoglossus hippoglossus]
MPFCKRTTLPKDVCKPGRGGLRLREARPRQPPEVFGDLADVVGFSLCSVLRQLSDLSRHSVSILEELEGELVSVCHRSGALEGRLVRLQRSVAELLSKPPPRATSGLEAEGGRRGGSSSSHGDGSHSGGGGGGSSSSSSGGGGGAAHFKSPWQQSVNVFGSWSRPDCVEELHQQAQLNLQSLLQDFEEQLYDTKLTGQTFRHPSSQSSDDTSTSLSRSPVSLNNKRPDFIFLPASKQLYEDETSSSVFGLRSATDPSPSPTPSPCGSDRPPLGWSSNNSSSSTATSANTGPPIAEKPRWHLGRRAPAHFLPHDITGEGGGGGGKFHGVDLLQHSPSPSPGDPFPHQPHSLEPVTDTPHQSLPLRKTHSDLDTTLPADKAVEHRVSNQLHPGTMDHSGLLCSNTPSASWNGPKGSTFSPGAWNEPYNYSMSKGPAVPPKQHSIIGHAGGGLQDGVMLVSSGQSMSSHGSSFTSVTDSSGRGGNIVPGISLVTPSMGKRSETEGAAADGGRRGGGGGVGEAGRGRERSARSIAAQKAFKFRERSLSTPTESGSFSFTEGGVGQPDGNIMSTGNGNALAITDHQQQHHHFLGLSENYALLYPRGSSEDSASTTDTISVTASDYSADGRLRLRSRSISLKKSKRKPPPPVRSVSLMKNLGEAEGRIHHDGGLYRDGRPKSLHIPRDHFPDFQPDFLLPSSSCSSRPNVSERELGHGGSDGPPSLEVQPPEREGETELTFPTHWQLGDWKSDPYRSLSGSSTATGTTVIECMKVRSSSESLLDSPSTSRGTSPSQLSMETEVKASSPFKPPGLMSPSSGYSSQSETPTPTVPLSHVAGQGTLGTLGCKMRPKIPERKSSLPSPKDPSARSRLSFEMPGNAHLELCSIKPKQKASRRHSDTSTAAKPGKVSPSSSHALPVVTQNELKTIRLRSVSRGDLEDCPDGASDTIEEEQHGRDFCEFPSPPPTLPKPKPPVAVKPPLPKRPINLLIKSPSPSSTSPLALDSPPGSPVDRPVPLGNIYKVMRKPKPKKPPPQTLSSPSGLPDSNFTANSQTGYDHPFLPHSHSLFDLPPLPDPQPLLEDPALEPEFESDHEIRLGPEDGGSLPSPCSNQEAQDLPDKSKTLPSRMTISCLAELSDKKKPKVPPPVPKKPSVLLLPTSVHSSTNGSADRQTPQADSPVGLRSPVGAFPPDDLPSAPCVPDMPELDENHLEPDEESSKESSLQSILQDSSFTELEGKMATTGIGADDSDEKTVLHIAEEADDDLPATPTTHTTEDLFTIIHRSKRRVLGRKEPTDSFGSRQSLVSPVKHSAGSTELRTMTLGSSQRSSSRNDNFMALLQKKGSKSSSGGARVSAMELLKSTNPLARRVTEFSTNTSTSAEGEEAAPGNGKPNDQ